MLPFHRGDAHEAAPVVHVSFHTVGAGLIGPRLSPVPIVMQTWILKRPMLSLYLLTLLAQGLRVAHGSDVTHFRGLLGSLLTAIAVTAMLGRRQGLHELFGRMLRLVPPR